MSISDSPNSVKLVFDYAPVYVKLRKLLSDASYSNDYGSYTQEQFDELVENLLFSYFHVDRAGSHGILYDAISTRETLSDHIEHLLADRALEIIEDIDDITKDHIPMIIEEYGSPFPSSEILDVQLVGASKMLIEITKSFYDKIKQTVLNLEANYAADLANRQPIPPKTK